MRQDAARTQWALEVRDAVERYVSCDAGCLTSFRQPNRGKMSSGSTGSARLKESPVVLLQYEKQGRAAAVKLQELESCVPAVAAASSFVLQHGRVERRRAPMHAKPTSFSATRIFHED